MCHTPIGIKNWRKHVQSVGEGREARKIREEEILSKVRRRRKDRNKVRRVEDETDNSNGERKSKKRRIEEVEEGKEEEVNPTKEDHGDRDDDK